jgi:DNA-binding PadR family transcriptional regulator
MCGRFHTTGCEFGQNEFEYEYCNCHSVKNHPACECTLGKTTIPKGLLHLAILSILKDKEMHGGGIHQSLKERFGIDTAKPIVYVMLRRMEEAGLVVSQWDTSGSGPAKRVYRITQDGIDYLKDAIDNLKNVVKLIRMLIGEEGSSDV